MKLAILNVSDQGPVESLFMMLRSIGYGCTYTSKELRDELRRIGCDTVLEVDNLVSQMGYERPVSLPEVCIADMRRSGVIFVDVKAQRNGKKIIERWPNLQNRVLWYRINGGKPEHVIRADGFDCGDECNPGCPILTPNMWYADDEACPTCGYTARTRDPICETCNGWQEPWHGGKAYAHWPPFYRFDEYMDTWDRVQVGYDPPICLIHNLQGWGYQALVGNVRALGVKCYGAGSPDGLIKHESVANRLAGAKAMVHLKSSDAPGYALYEALAAGCPVVCSRRLIWRNRMQELFEPGKTCLVFDRETHDALSESDVILCTNEIKRNLEILSDPTENRRVGLAGRERLMSLMWSQNKESDRVGFSEWVRRMFL